MSLKNILILVLVLMMIGVLPAWPHAATWGYEPSGALFVIIIILLLFKL